MNILFLTESITNACSFYRVAGIVKDLRRKMPDDNFVVAQWNQIELHWATIADFDLIMIQRPFKKAALDLCTFIKGMNIPIWIDYDDNLLCVPPENKTHQIYDDLEIKESIKKIIALADIVTVTTDDLKQSFSEFNKNIDVIPNAFNDIIFKRGILPQRSNVILWRGTDTHIYDVMSYGKAISKATSEFKEKQFLYVGYYPWFMPKADNMFFLTEMDLILYFRNVYKMAPAIMHVPLVDELFNRCKSNIAYIEGSYFGAACVVPDFWKTPGALHYKSQDEYYESLRALLGGEINIEIQNRIAWEYVMDNLRLSKVNVKRVEIINSLI